MGASARGGRGYRDLEEHSVLQGRAWRLEEHKNTENTKYMGASARKGRHRDTQCSARQGTLYRNTQETGFLQEGRAWRDSGPSFEEHKGHGEREEAEGQLDLCKSKTPRDTGPSTRRRRWTWGLRKEMTRSC